MFVRIIEHHKENDSSIRIYSGLYEGDAIRFHEQKEDDAGLVTISHVRGAKDLAFKKSETELYIMNNEGRTIDSYDWRPSS